MNFLQAWIVPEAIADVLIVFRGGSYIVPVMRLIFVNLFIESRFDVKICIEIRAFPGLSEEPDLHIEILEKNQSRDFLWVYV